ncbi:NnrU family protein [Pseudorhodoplanes sinuspersici]|uniref:NnrU family protein n=1 Tax=Pseudorhodoplanes sinuspersici TaxID=1235591 RepID=A0A1W6ZXR2_9HYPH|nr:NnrU family protein [Pseudorhodoplanes sinuspersici]ARQ02177.1 NnrU family protein [Pseudorhodoplanes sinuspersici]RKE73991.1 putative membrane protein [Pseudorhodoplanes sinuspersici]
MGLVTLVLGLIVFIAPHVFVTQRQARANLIARIGEGPYKIGFSILSAIGIVLIAYGFAWYRASEWINVWSPPVWTRHLALVLVWPAIIMIVAAYIPGNIKRVLKHPMLAGVKLWALAHLLANGDLGSIILFGSILAWAVYDRISLKRRTDAGAPSIPVGGWPRDVAAVIVGTLVYLVLAFWFHPAVIGVPVMPR